MATFYSGIVILKTFLIMQLIIPYHTINEISVYSLSEYDILYKGGSNENGSRVGLRNGLIISI